VDKNSFFRSVLGSDCFKAPFRFNFPFARFDVLFYFFTSALRGIWGKMDTVGNSQEVLSNGGWMHALHCMRLWISYLLA
jgi:hypothetical protein